MFKRIYFLVLLAFLFQLTACKKEEPTLSKGKYEKGLFVINEGQFNTGNGSIDFYDPTNGSIELDIFQKVNARPLGDIVQSLSFHNGLGFIVVNNSAKMEIVDENTFESKGVVRNLALPRYFQGIDAGKAYLSEWGDGFSGKIQVIDLNTKTITKTIPLNTNGAGRMLKIENRVFVLNDGGYSSDSTLTILNASTDEIIQQVQTPHNPNSILKDKNGNLWVLCGGKKVYDPITFQLILSESTESQLIQINPTNLQIVKRIYFTDKTAIADNLTSDAAGEKLFYMYNGSVYTIGIEANTAATTPLIANTYFYGLKWYNNQLFAADAGNFTSSGKIKIYNETDGSLIKELTVGVIPNGFISK